MPTMRGSPVAVCNAVLINKHSKTTHLRARILQTLLLLAANFDGTLSGFRDFCPLTQGSSFVPPSSKALRRAGATLGWRTQSLWDWGIQACIRKACINAQPAESETARPGSDTPRAVAPLPAN